MKSLRLQVIAMLILLVVEFILGILTNLYVSMPIALRNGSAWKFAMTESPMLTLHIVVGTLLVILSITILIGAISAQKSVQIGFAVVGFILICLTWMSGSTFLTNGQSPLSSFLMSLGFMFAMTTYGIELYRLSAERQS